MTDIKVIPRSFHTDLTGDDYRLQQKGAMLTLLQMVETSPEVYNQTSDEAVYELFLAPQADYGNLVFLQMIEPSGVVAMVSLDFTAITDEQMNVLRTTQDTLDTM